MAFGMRIGLISDVHGNDAALKAVLGALQERVDSILFMGDLVGKTISTKKSTSYIGLLQKNR